MAESKNGTVKWFKKTYGFITGADGNDYFVHYSDINTEGYKTLEAGQEVTFNVKASEKGEQAVNVAIVG